MIDKPCACKEPCGHYAWLEDPDYLAEDLTIPVGASVMGQDMDKNESEEPSMKNRLFMEGKCVKCKEKVEPLPDEVFTKKGLLEYPLHNFNACNGTLYHLECPKDKILTDSQSLIQKDLLLD